MNGDNKSQKDLSLPSLTALRCFEVAARTEHFSRAADELHLTHGAVSRAVRLLEEDLGVMLFERRQRRVFLTEAGEQLYQAVREGLGGIRQTAQSLRQQSRPQSLVISCEPTLLMRWLIPRWPAFQALHPELDVHLMAGGGALRFGATTFTGLMTFTASCCLRSRPGQSVSRARWRSFSSHKEGCQRCAPLPPACTPRPVPPPGKAGWNRPD